jgi:hypothetical protein
MASKFSKSKPGFIMDPIEQKKNKGLVSLLWILKTVFLGKWV